MQTRGLFFKPGFTGSVAFKRGYPGHLSVADSQIVYYKQLRGGQMEVYLDNSRRSVFSVGPMCECTLTQPLKTRALLLQMWGD